ncbi:shikimate dehydrogenase [Paracraurococcus ruber]|uniref:Shikimate dehydrogenase n=1 Tax=Paracraurococcus ruber TaxID=77675 RepID=A0ABS1CUW4_9PROT|nr:shikimate dehydrogenase [Paracraurococcus ruber]MBK1657817.1 shikimate dehydrogenase [Paracraurococcus ruber]TDG31405.1 shikimate dehydrogenase [Paracraurococcus ruber]
MTTPARDPLLLGLIGTGIRQSRSPALHMAEAAAQGVTCVYRTIDLTALALGVEALPDLLTAAERMGFDGLNITHPCKQAVLPLLHDLSPEAAALGAVNTVVLRGGRRTGHNTDCTGFAEGFRRQLPDVPLRRAVQLGAGGAGTAVAEAAMQLGIGHLTLLDRDPARAEAVATALCARHGAGRAGAGRDLAAAMAEADGLIHATPTGMAAHPGLPLDATLLQPRHWVSEVVYVPLETELLRAARARGCRTAHGGMMAVFQAVHAFRLFSGLEPNADRMLAHFAGMG